MNENLELKIGSRFDSSGLESLNKGIQQAGNNVKRASGIMNQALGTLGEVDGAVGKVASKTSNFLGSFLAGGPLAAAMAAIGLFLSETVSRFKALTAAQNEAREASRALRDQMLNGMERTHQLTLKHLEAKREKERKAAEEAEKEAKRIAAERAAAVAAHERAQAQWNALLDKRGQLAIQQMKPGQTDGDPIQNAQNQAKIARAEAELRVKNAQRTLANAIDHHGKASIEAMHAEQDLKAAEVALALTIKQNEKAVADAIKTVNDENAARAAAAEAAKVRAAKEKKAAEAAEKIEKVKAQHEEAVKRIDERLAKAREEAARLEENAARARGKSFNEWDRGERARARDEEREAKKQAGFLERAAREQAAIGQRIFDRNGRLRKGANKADIERWKKLNEFQLNNDPKNNPALKEAERLEKERRELEAKTQRDVADIKAALNGAMTP